MSEKKSFIQKAKSILQVFQTPVPQLETLEKAKSGLAHREDDLFRSSFYLPFGGQYQGSGYRDKYTRINFLTLRMMAYRDSIISSIIQTRLNQVANFCRPQRNKYEPGYIIERKHKDGAPNGEHTQQIREITSFILTCGSTEFRPPEEKCSFEEFLRKIIRDRLVYDQVAVEKILDNKKDIHHFLPVDSSTIRLASPLSSPYYSETDPSEDLKLGNKVSPKPTIPEQTGEHPDYVQLIDGKLVRSFSREELILRFGNPNTDIYTNGYSVGELELLINIVTSHLHAENYNKLFFTQGHVAKGLLHFKANLPQSKLEAFRQAWYAQTTGNVNSWRTPIIAMNDDVKWVPLTLSNREMEFQSWMNYLIKICCAIYQISPSEIGFDISRDVDTSPSFFEANNETRIKHSQDKGLSPLLRFVEDMINEDILAFIYPDYIFRFVGYNIDTERDEVNRNQIESQTFKRIDEIRAQHDMEPLGEENGGHLILNPNYLNWLSQFGKMEQKKTLENLESTTEIQQSAQQETMKQQQEMQKPQEQTKKPLTKSQTKLLKVEYWRNQ